MISQPIEVTPEATFFTIKEIEQFTAVLRKRGAEDDQPVFLRWFPYTALRAHIDLGGEDKKEMKKK
jgi:hypothetical protein